MKRTLFLLIVALLALLLAGSAAAESDGPPAASSYTGTLTVIVGDPMPIEGEPMTPIPPIFTLHLNDGRDLTLLPGAAGENELLRLAGQRVSVTLPAAEAEAALAADDPAAAGVAVTSVGLAPGAVMASPEVSGNTKWITIACKFADVADEPKTLSYFTNMYANTYPGLDHYWREASYGNINLAGSTAVGWYTLPQPMSAYQIDNQNIYWTDLLLDCAALADPVVNFADYMGINLMLNGMPGCCAWGGNRTVTLDGVTKTWSVTWLPPFAYTDLAYIHHEMTHAYGILWHSYAGNNAYGDYWDVVSNAMACGNGPHVVYGCLGEHTQVYHRHYLGWIPDSRVITLGGNGPHTVTLERTTQPNATGYLMAIVPINGSTTHYYTIEARQRVGYDKNLWGSSITIHEIGPSENNVAAMDPFAANNEAFYQWPVGQTWVSPDAGITVHIDAATDTGFVVTVTSGWVTKTATLAPTADTYADHEAPNSNFGGSKVLKTRGGFQGNYSLGKATFLKFDPAQLPPLVARARLRLYVLEACCGGYMPTAHVYRPTYVGTTTPWDEYGLTWNNMWENYGWMQVYRPTDQGSNWLEWNIAGFVVVYGAEVLNSLLLDNAQFTFSSREGANPPQLIIDYLVPPDETTTTTFLPTNDASVSQAKPKLISGTKPTLQVKDAAKDFNAYVKFNVTGLTGTVQSATLRLWVRDGGPDGGRVYSTSPFYLNTTTQWLETGLKWSNAPPIGGTALDSAGAVVVGQWIELDVTAAVTGNGRASFALTNDSTNLVTYSSKEGPHAPELVVITN